MGRVLAVLAALVTVLAIGAPAVACEVVVYAYPRPPLQLERLSRQETTVVSGRYLGSRVIETFEPWGEPGGIVWEVTVSLDPLDSADLPQPTTFEMVNNPCGRPLGSPVEGEPFRFLLERDRDGWTVKDFITAADLTRYLAWRADH